MDIQNIIIGAATTVITGIITWFSTKIVAWLEEKTRSNKIDRYMKMWKDAANMAVSKVAQNYVDAARDANGKLTQEQAHEALKLAKALIKGTMSAESYRTIQEFVQDMDAWIEFLIEDEVRKDDLEQKRKCS